MQGAYVVRIGAYAQQNREELAGQVEEVDSGRSQRFRSGEELLQFLRQRQQDALAELEKNRQQQ
jgi:hypothetical protein